MTSFGWLLVTLGPLLIFQRILHREIQAVLLILTRRADLTIMLFSLLFFPGVLLHEGSHWLMAKILGVRTGRVSLMPRVVTKSRLQMGFVETAQSDWFRDALIGAAPLISGVIFIAFAGIYRLQTAALWSDALSGAGLSLVEPLQAFTSQPDFWLWFYLIFVVSSTMFPSASDRRAWLPIGMVFAGMLGLAVLAGAGAWLVDSLVTPAGSLFKVLSIIFAISGIFHLVLLLPTWGLRLILSRLTGYDVV